METKTRRAVFETNSSSTHSISICELDSLDMMDNSLIPNENGEIVLNGGEFGWDEETFDRAQDKASYMAVYVEQWYPNDEVDGDSLKEILLSVIKNQTGCKEVVFNFSDSFRDPNGKSWGYIDHQSVETRDYHYLFEDPKLFRQFIFNKGSKLVTDNDNH